MSNYDKASEALHAWACGHLTTNEAKNECRFYGFHVDFRQGDSGATMDAVNIETGATVEIEV